jgi:hypothetical protein
MSDYNTCIRTAHKKLCARGYCSAKQLFKVYPSAYANGYASSVCQGKKPDFLGQTYSDDRYMRAKARSSGKSPLQRWFKEEWVNVCKKGKGAGGYASCGRNKADLSPGSYPYCRPYYKLPGTTVTTVRELTAADIKGMCSVKHSLSQPSRVVLSKSRPKSRRSRVLG